MHFKFICSHLHDAFPLIYINLCNYFCLFTRPLPGTAVDPLLAVSLVQATLLLCPSPSPSLFHCYSLLVCLSRCPTVCVCVCVRVFIEQVHCPCKIFGSLLLSLLSFDQLDRGVAAKGESETGGFSYFFIDLTVQSSRQRRHNLSSHCLRHMFDVYKFNLIYLNNYVSFGSVRTVQGRQGAAQKQSQSEIAIDGRTMQAESGEERGERREGGCRSRSHSY